MEQTGMCGIIGAVSQRNVTSFLLEGLKKLEYRGYDSAGIVVINQDQQFHRHRVLGKVNDLQQLLDEKPIAGTTGIAHTRWATHGKPSENNAHPHISNNEIALVHNGIIENHEKLREYLLSQSCEPTSETDSELVAHLVYLNIKSGLDFLTAVRHTLKELKGAYAFSLIRRTESNHMIAVRCGSPLVIGLGDHENYIASDELALLALTKKFIYLEDGDIADIYDDKIMIYDTAGQPVERTIHFSQLTHDNITKGPYRHFMLKEIFEQPEAVVSTLSGRLSSNHVFSEIFGVNAPDIFKKINRIELVACGTSYHACLIGKYWLESIAGTPCQTEIASENRYRPKVIEPNTLFVTLSQSGETADTLAALHLAKKSGYLASLAICNVPNSSLARESDLVLLTGAGPEIGVASTKAFTTQLTALLLLTTVLYARHHDAAKMIHLLKLIPNSLQQALKLEPAIKHVAASLVNKQHVLFLGRGIQLPIAMEGALKLKEISYIHAEAYPAGELKHGPIALIDENIPVIALIPHDELLEKIKSNMQEILARNGHIIAFTDPDTGIKTNAQVTAIKMPSVDKIISPLVYSIAVQLLAYHVADMKGTDIDQPRNLAKSVTVE
jgi:glucosamine--fructose-6-phosphate aminotransferase (isomerizing)